MVEKAASMVERSDIDGGKSTNGRAGLRHRSRRRGVTMVEKAASMVERSDIDAGKSTNGRIVVRQLSRRKGASMPEKAASTPERSDIDPGRTPHGRVGPWHRSREIGASVPKKAASMPASAAAPEGASGTGRDRRRSSGDRRRWVVRDRLRRGACARTDGPVPENAVMRFKADENVPDALSQRVPFTTETRRQRELSVSLSLCGEPLVAPTPPSAGCTMASRLAERANEVSPQVLFRPF